MNSCPFKQILDMDYFLSSVMKYFILFVISVCFYSKFGCKSFNYHLLPIHSGMKMLDNPYKRSQATCTLEEKYSLWYDCTIKVIVTYTYFRHEKHSKNFLTSRRRRKIFSKKAAQPAKHKPIAREANFTTLHVRILFSLEFSQSGSKRKKKKIRPSYNKQALLIKR